LAQVIPQDTVRADSTRRDSAARPSGVGLRVARDTVALRLPTVLSRAERETYRRAIEQIEAARATAFQQNMRSIIQAVWGQVAASTFATAEKPPPFAVAPEDKSDRKVAARAGDIIAEHSDLSLQLNARMELRAEKNLNERCAVSGFVQPVFDCQSSFLPLLDFQFNAKSGGVVADRVHVDVDYDTQREFDGSNNISVNYEGRGNELIQRVELGNVTFQPPVSRFITAGIPSGNYGIQAIAKVGSARIRGIVAQQKGNIVSDRVFTIGDRTLSAVDRRIEDHQFEPRRFFFTVPPRVLGAAYPNIDILDSRRMEALAASLPDTLRPTRVFLYRLLIGGQPPNPSGPQFRILGDPRSKRGPVYERLREGIDYYVDPSQLWVALVRPLSLNNERLVVAYRVRINGRDTVHVSTGGTPDLEFRSQSEQFANLLWDPQVTPQDPAFEREIRSVYRIGGPEVRRPSVVVKVVTGTSDDQEKAVESETQTANTYLQLFGLAQRTNTSTFDIENRLWPRPADPNFELSLGASAAKVIRDQFLVFPSLRPFAKNGLARGGNPANDTIYTTPSEYVKSAQRPQSVYHIRVRYQAEGSGEGGALMLGAVQVRPNSERLTIDGLPLVRGTDYTVDYDLGRVAFLRPDTLFPRPRQITAQFEENPVFAESPTSIFGATAEIPFDNGSVNFTAISQSQNTTFNRPPLGFEPAASLVAGVTAQFGFDATPLTALVSKLPYGETTAPSRINVSGEFAASRPKPNEAGQAFVESFEGEGGILVPLDEAQWYYSSQPALGRAVPARVGAATLDIERASTMAWQSDGLDARGSAIRPRIEDIDPLTNIIGTGLSAPEPLLWMTLYPLGVGGLRDEGAFQWVVRNAPTGRRWRSIRTPLGPTGSDLSRIESIEFWAQIPVSAARRQRNPILMLDFGDVSENSVNFAPDTMNIRRGQADPSARDTTFRGKQLQGFDRLDSERDAFSRAFNQGVNDNGIAGDLAGAITVVRDTIVGGSPIIETLGNFATCRGGYSLIRILGDSRTNCSVGNNRLDEEDVDADNVLNLTSAERESEEVRRYIVNLADSGSYTRIGRCGPGPRTVVGPPPEDRCWVLFRVPFRAVDDSIGSPLLRRMRALRVTMISSPGIPDNEFTQIPIARLRLTGAPWLKRSEATLRGVAAETPSGGFVNAGVIGTQDRGLAGGISYESPPGVTDEPDTKRSNFQTNRVQINERSLRLTAGGLDLFDRAEAYFRFPEGEKNFMAYKELRLWARGVRNGWGDIGAELQFYVKIGRDPDNFYFYRTPLNGGNDRSAWLPEVKVDFEKLFRLSAQIQNAYLQGTAKATCTGIDSALIANTPLPASGVRYVACADGYIAYTSDPGVTPPNLAGVQELSVGMIRTQLGGSSRPISPTDTLELWVDDIRLGGVVDEAGFAGQMALTILASDFADIRLSMSRRDPHFRQLAEQPSFLTDNSVNVSGAFHLEKLLPRSFGWSVPVSVNYASSSSDPLFVSRTDVEGDIVEGLRTPKSSATSVTFAMSRATPIKDSRFAPILNNLSLLGTYSSGRVRTEYEEGRASNLTVGLDYNLSRALLPELSRWAPAELHLTSVYTRGDDRRSVFLKPAEARDDIPRRIAGLTSTWRNGTSLQLRPSRAFSGRLDFNSVRDLRGYGDDTPLGVITGTDRISVFGAGAGIEREREMQAGFNFTPQFSSWIRPRVEFGSEYNMLRDPNTLSFLRVEDSVGSLRLPRRLGSTQTTTAGVTLDLPKAADRFIDSTSWFHGFLKSVQPIDVNFNRSLLSVFDQSPSEAPISYQLAFGNMHRFREIEGNPATSAGLVNQLSANHTIALPFGVSLANRYQLISARNWTRRPDESQAVTDGTQVVFPDLSLRWSMKPDRLRRVISSIGGTARAVQTKQLNSRQPDRIGAPLLESDAANTVEPTFLADRVEILVRSFPANLAIVFAGARPLTANLSYALSTRSEKRPGLSARSGSNDISIELAKPWAVPADWKLRSDIRTRVSYQDTQGDNFVLNPLALSRESRLTDNGRRAFSFSADTDVAENLSSSFVFSRVESFDLNLNRRFTQTVLSAVLHLQFFGGELQ
jgi:hypothetical protein